MFPKNTIIDAHSHVQFPAYDRDREEVVERARGAGVKMIAVGTQISTSESAIKFAHEYPGDVWATVGYHPSHLLEDWHHDEKEQPSSLKEEFDINRIRDLAKDSKVVGIGECGLDYFRIMNNESGIKDRQKEVFLQQAELAKELNKALMIHCRPSKGTDDAYEDLLTLLTTNNRQLTTVIHFYVGGLEVTKKLVEAGFRFTFGGVVTFARDYDESIKYIPLDRILLETDCPYVAPKSNRGKRNEPSYIRETAQKLAEIKNLDVEAILEKILENSTRLFGFSTERASI